jgi:sugar phosphate isomerase/epimerase
MYFTGFADEAGPDLEVQIRVTRELGWNNIEMRNVAVAGAPAGMFHDIPEKDFQIAADRLDAAGVNINCFGSAIANWGHKIEDPFEITLTEVRRAIPRMQRLRTKLIRIMSYAVRKAEDQMAGERFRRLREIRSMFADAGLLAVHENCMNYGGMGWQFTRQLVENVPGLKLALDTGNPISSDDWSKPEPRPKQSSWDFYEHVREHVAYVHIKDGRWDAAAGKLICTYPGEGQGDTRRILKDLLARGYDGGFSIEPHMAAVFHDPNSKHAGDAAAIYVEYGRRLMKMVAELKTELGRK